MCKVMECNTLSIILFLKAVGDGISFPLGSTGWVSRQSAINGQSISLSVVIILKLRTVHKICALKF